MKRLLALIMTVTMLAAIVPAAFAEGGLVPRAGSHLVIGDVYIENIDGTITVGELAANFEGNIDVAGKASAAAVASDDVVSCGGDSVRALIWGDGTRDGKISVTDVTASLKLIAAWDVSVCERALDVNVDGKVTLSDVTKLLKYLAKWDNISLGNVRMIFENARVSAEHDDASVDVFFASPLRKIRREDTANTGELAYEMKLARNEVESCQVFFTSETDREGLTVSVSPLEYEFGGCSLTAEIFRYHYYKLSIWQDVFAPDYGSEDGYFPEPMLPNETAFELLSDRAQGFMMNVRTDADTPAGTYKGYVTLTDAEGREIKKAAVYAYVWDFTLPETPSSASAFGIDYPEAIGYSKAAGDPEREDAVREQYYEFLLDYKLTPSELPYKLWDERAGRYLDDPRVTSVRTFPSMGAFAYSSEFGDGTLPVSGAEKDRAEMENELVRSFEVLYGNEKWYDKHYITAIDEPYDQDTLDREKAVRDWIAEKLNAHFGKADFNLMLCLAQNNYYGSTMFDYVHFLGDVINVWCPSSAAYTASNCNVERASIGWHGRYFESKYGTFEKRMAEERAGGDKIWWYICCGPEFPYANFFVFYNGVPARVLLWQQYRFNTDGILYWNTTYQWNQISKNHYGCDGHGDGQLLFPGEMFGLHGPVASYRLVQIRDGFDDYDYLKLAEAKVGRDAVLRAIAPVAEEILPYTTDYRVMESTREAIVKLILE